MNKEKFDDFVHQANLGKKEEMDLVYSNLEPDKEGFISVDKLLKMNSDNTLMKNFMEKVNENLQTTSEIITNKLKKLKRKISNDKESEADIEW